MLGDILVKVAWFIGLVLFMDAMIIIRAIIYKDSRRVVFWIVVVLDSFALIIFILYMVGFDTSEFFNVVDSNKTLIVILLFIIVLAVILLVGNKEKDE